MGVDQCYHSDPGNGGSSQQVAGMNEVRGNQDLEIVFSSFFFLLLFGDSVT